MLTAEDKSTIITCPPPSSQQPAWRKALAAAVTDPAELLSLLGLDPALLPAARKAHQRFRVRVPRGFIERMRPADPDDPLLRQVLPVAAELEEVDGFSADPVGDDAATLGPGLLSKYAGRALFIATGACAVNCRYCFRREYPYDTGLAVAADWAPALRQLDQLPGVSELILSGGDPLVLGDDRLRILSNALLARPAIRRLRIHSRLPIVLPERIDDSFLGWVTSLPVPLVMVVHANHAREINQPVIEAMDAMRRAGATVLNQSVLLAGVNDSGEALVELSEALFSCGVLPYYLHMLDRVRGAAHFEVPESRALELARTMAARLPGYLVPRLVREVPGAPAKTLLDLAPIAETVTLGGAV
ncbi:MAG: EF-P beta-lysylation protein EpmB [Gammaproteobacteria bacterium]